MNPLFNNLAMINQFKNNPMGLLQQKFNLPANMNDPQAIVQHLLNTGQISQAQVNQAMEMRNNSMVQQMFNNMK